AAGRLQALCPVRMRLAHRGKVPGRLGGTLPPGTVVARQTTAPRPAGGGFRPGGPGGGPGGHPQGRAARQPPPGAAPPPDGTAAVKVSTTYPARSEAADTPVDTYICHACVHVWDMPRRLEPLAARLERVSNTQS